MSALTELTIAKAGEGLAMGEFTARELTDAYLSAMADAKALNAYIVETPDLARQMADASDARRAKGIKRNISIIKATAWLQNTG